MSPEVLFSNREMEVLSLIAKGYRTYEMAEKLFISGKTIETHRKNLIHKSQVKNTAELIAFAHERGLL
ncbi:MAG: response regulator transcription factor [Sphingobacteriales bacterium]|nr:MAG: response regulator transcription factor [Sphingobacteriales bacterium]